MNDPQTMKLQQKVLLNAFLYFAFKYLPFLPICLFIELQIVMPFLKTFFWPARSTEFLFYVNRMTHFTTGCNILSML